jgi:predicted DNA-binding protein (MmcQ/YjbR family)
LEASEPLERLRAICLALPEASERETWGEATFRVRDKIFAMAGDGNGKGRLAMSCKAPPGLQAALVETDPARFFVPPYVGSKGWIGAYLGDVTDWDELADLVEESYRMTAPKRVAALLDQPGR